MNLDNNSPGLSPEERLEIAQGFDKSFDRMKSWVWTARWIPISAVLLLCLIFAGDYVSVRYRMIKGSNPFGVVEVDRYYKIHLKNGKSQYASSDSEDQTCVQSMFPHLGYSPCWYVKRNSQQQVDFY